MANNNAKQVTVKYTGKGKEVSGKSKTVTGKRKGTEKTGGRSKRNRGVVKFFEVVADEVDGDDDDRDDESDFDYHPDFFGNEFEAQSSKVNNEPEKAQRLPFFLEDDEPSEGESENMVEERYGPSSNYVTYADDTRNANIPVHDNENLPSYKEPTVWKVRCTMGHEKQSVFCLMQKYAELEFLGKKLQIISSFSVDHVKGFIYIEAETKADINEACKGMSTVYSSRILLVPKNEVSSTLSVRSKCNEISIGSWTRVKNGKYKGDLAQIITVNDTRKKATVKLIPRIDLQVLAEKYGGGGRSRKNVVPPRRFVTSTELEEFRPLIQCRRDRETGLAFEILDGMMLRDGYLYKKVKTDSLSFYGVMPSEAELLKFESSDNENPVCEDWLTELYGEKNKGLRVGERKGVGREGEGSSSLSNETSFKIGDLVLFNFKDFGVILDLEKEEYYKILKEGSEGPETLTVDLRQLKKASFENRFTALDKIKKIISVNDIVKVLEGPLKGRKGNVKHIYRGTIFFHDEVEQENNGYLCCRSQVCEKIKLSDDNSKEKGSESLFPSSSESPLVPEKPREPRGKNNSFKKEDQQGFTVGQSLRIRTGPLKGYLCRCLAIRRADVTVKLDSLPKVFTVKYDNLVEVRGRSSAFPMRSSPPSFQSRGTSAQPEIDSSMEIEKKDDEKSDVTKEQAGGWRNSEGNWHKLKTSLRDHAGRRSGGKNCGTKPSSTGQAGSSQIAQAIRGPNSKIVASSNAYSTWGKKDKGNGGTNAVSIWGKSGNAKDANSPNLGNTLNAGGGQVRNWNKINTNNNYSAPLWGKNIEPPNAGQGITWKSDNYMIKDDSGPAWGNTVKSPDFGQGGNWGKDTKNAKRFTPDWGKTVQIPNANQGGGSSWVSKQSDQKKQNWDHANAFHRGRGSGEMCGERGGRGRSSWGQQNGGNSESYGKDLRGMYAGGRAGAFTGIRARGWGGGGGRGERRGESGGFRGGRGGRSFGQDRGGRGVGQRGRGGGVRGSFQGRGRSGRGGGGRGRGMKDNNSKWGNSQSGGGGGWSGGNDFDNSGGSMLGEQPSNLEETSHSARGNNLGSVPWNKMGPANGGQFAGCGERKGSNRRRGSGGQWGKPASKGGW